MTDPSSSSEPPPLPQPPASDQKQIYQEAQKAKGKKLLRVSRFLLLVAVVLFCLSACGCVMGGRVEPTPLEAMACLLGFLLIVASAIVGQIARAYQGRVI